MRVEKAIFLVLAVSVILTPAVMAEEVHDVAITWIDPPFSGVQYITINYSLTNEGTVNEIGNVTVRDLTGNDTICVTNIEVMPNQTIYWFCNWNAGNASAGDHTITVTAGVPGETDTADNSKTTTVTVIEPVHNVVMNNVTAPASAYLGTVVPIDVYVGNQGNVNEYMLNVALKDLTDNRIIDTKTIYLDSSDTNKKVTFSWDTTGSSEGDHTLEAIVGPVPNETNITDNSITTAMAILVVHDVAVTSIYATNPVIQGEYARINYSVKNEGMVNETVTVVVNDSTEGVMICTDSFVLPPSQVANLYCSWNTANASPGNHTIIATAGQIPNETDTADNSRTAFVTIQPIIYDGYISSLTTDQPKYKATQIVYATALVVNTGNQVLNATVRFSYIRPDLVIDFTENQQVSVPIGSQVSTSSSYTIPRNSPPGTWKVRSELIHGSDILDTKESTFELVKRL